MAYKAQYLWTVEDFSKFPAQVGFEVISPPFHQYGPDGLKAVWRVVLYPYGISDNREGCISLGARLERCNYSAIRVKTQVHFEVKHGSERLFERKKVDEKPYEYATTTKRMWPWQEFVSALNARTIKDRPSSTVTILCEVYDPTISGVLLNELLPLQLPLELPESQFWDQSWMMYENHKFTDVSLIARNKEFKLHKFILAVRSPVFAAMFQHELQESIEHKVVITDFEPEVIEEFVEFAYSGKCNFNQKELLIFSDKYDVKDLKSSCEIALIYGLECEIAAGMLHLADNRGAPRLKVAALSFIKSNITKVMVTEEWKSMSHELKDDIIKSLIETLARVLDSEKAD